MLTVDASVASRQSYGGTAPARVREQVAAWKGEAGLRGDIPAARASYSQAANHSLIYPRLMP